MIIYKSSTGHPKYFQIFEADGETPKPLAGMTVTWKFKDRDGNTLSKTMEIETEDEGIVYFVITSDITTAAIRWTCQIWISDGADYNRPTDEFIVDIEEKT